MTQHMGMMEFSDEEEQEEDATIGYLQLLPPFGKTLGWLTTELKDGKSSCHDAVLPAVYVKPL